MTTNGIGIKDLQTMEDFFKGKEITSTPDSPFYYVDYPEPAILVNPSKLRPFKKAPFITTPMNIEDIKLLETMNNKYLPIINTETKENVFTKDAFQNYRKKMSGLTEYGTGDYIFSDNLYFPGIEHYLEKIDANITKVDSYREKVYAEIKKILESHGYTVTIGCNSGGDIELVEAGSTSRYTNIPSTDSSKKWDFDFTVRFNPEETWKVKEILETELKAGDHITRTSAYKVRLLDATITGLEKPIDIDFSLTPQKEKYLSTEDAISERLDKMKAQDPEKYRLVLANIMFAKALLKASGAYKPARGILEGDRQMGGLGGVGIENWLLQNGGSLLDASREFLSHATDADFKEFETNYSIMDFGANHVGKSKHIWPYDNFIINNMRYLGYEKMRETLQKFINTLDQKEEKEELEVHTL